MQIDSYEDTQKCLTDWLGKECYKVLYWTKLQQLNIDFWYTLKIVGKLGLFHQSLS